MSLKDILGEELYNQVTAKLGDKHQVAIINDGNWFPKSKWDELNATKKKLETDIADRDKQLETLGKAAGTSEELKKQIEQLQADNKAAADKHAADLKELQLSGAIKAALAGKVHDEALVAGLVERGKLVLDGEKVVGLEEQIKTLQESKAFLFKTEDTQQKPGFHTKIGGDGVPTPPGNQTPTLKDAITAHFQKQQ